MTNRGRFIALTLAVALPVACRDNGPTATGSPEVAASTAAAVEAAASANHPSIDVAKPDDNDRGGTMKSVGGPVGRFLGAARELSLSADQKMQIDKLDAQLRASSPSRDTGMKAFHDELLAGVRAGKIDTSTLEPHYVAIERVKQERHDEEVAALDTMYKVLDATQRKALVASIRAKDAAHEAKAADHAVDKDEKDTVRQKRKLERLTSELDLDATQQKSVEGVIAKNFRATDAMREKAKKDRDALLAAFEGDRFEAKKLDFGAGDAKKARDHMQQHVQFLSQLLPILHPDQREKLAVSMAKHTHGGAHGGGEMEWDDGGMEDGHAR